jgi:hypothetical protein
MEETTTLELSPRHQLVDLNKKLVNFKLDFNVVSLNDKEFEAVVMNQTDINKYDNLDTIEMKTAPKKISGNIIADNNTYENYFLILRSNDPQNVEIKTIVEEIPPRQEEPFVEEENSTVAKSSPFYKTRGCWALIAIAVILLGFYLKDHFFKKTKGKDVVTSIQENIVTPVKETVTPFVQKLNDTLSNVDGMISEE